MAINQVVVPSAKQVAYRPIIFECSSDRKSPSTHTVISVTSGGGGKVRYTFPVSPVNLMYVGDIVTPSGFTGAAVVYNVKQTVMVTAPTYIETDLAYSVVSAGSPIVTRTNYKFQLKGELYAFNNYELPVTAVANAGGGNLEFTLSSNHGYAIGDVVLVLETVSYNNPYKILSMSAGNKFTAAGTFVSTQTGTVKKGAFIGSKFQSAIIINGDELFRFSFSNYLQSELTPDLLEFGLDGIQKELLNSAKWYTVKFTEYFDDKNGLTKIGNTALSVQKIAVRASLKHTETQSLSAYILSISLAKFLSNAPTKRHIRIGEEDQLSFLANAGTVYHPYIKSYGIAGNLISTVTGTGLFTVNAKLILPVNSNYITSNLSKVEVAIWDATLSAVVSETITYVIDNNCYQNPIRLYFENYLGGFDPFTFTGFYKRINASKKTTFKKDLSPSFAVKDTGETVMGVNADTGVEVWSRFLTRAEGVWLEELINSVNVYVMEGSNLVPITIINSNDPTDDTQGPLQLKLQFRYANSPIPLSN